MSHNDKTDQCIQENLLKAEDLLAKECPSEARDVFLRITDLLYKFKENQYEMAALVEHRIGIASQQLFQMKKAVLHYQTALDLCAKLKEGEGEELRRAVLVSLANCLQGPLDNTEEAELTRSQLISVTGYESTTECYICLEECVSGDPVWVMPCCRFYHLHCIRRWQEESKAKATTATAASSSSSLPCPDCRVSCSEIQAPCGRWSFPPPDPAAPKKEYQVSEYKSIYSKEGEGEEEQIEGRYALEPWYRSSVDVPDYEAQSSHFQPQEYVFTSDYVPQEYTPDADISRDYVPQDYTPIESEYVPQEYVPQEYNPQEMSAYHAQDLLTAEYQLRRNSQETESVEATQSNLVGGTWHH